MSAGYTGAIVVIPTRNRADLAQAAIRSVLSQQNCGDLYILVSDNSTSKEEAAQLSRFCEGAGDPRLRYIKPPQPLPIAEHWNWAAHQIANSHEETHITFLTDRMVFKPWALSTLAEIASQYSQQIISYLHDRVIDNQKPVRLNQHLWTGNTFEVKSTRLLQLSARSELHEMLPRMLNCLVPRRVLTDLHSRYGEFFGSNAPDFNFCYRSLELEDSLIFFDAAPLVHYALDRSIGASVSRGQGSKDSVHFLESLRQRRGLFAAPIPEIITARNGIAHEYCFVRNETRSPKFPSLEQERYLQATAAELGEIVNPQIRQETEALLTAHGWVKPGLMARQRSLARRVLSPGRVARRFARAVRPRNELGFASSAEALKYAVNFQGQRVDSQPELERSFELVPLPLERSLSIPQT